MKRRDFLAAASTMLLPVMVDGFGVKSMAKNSALIQSLKNTQALNSDRILVMVYLSGGNDGLNTVIPIEHYSAYNSLRSNIAIPAAQVLALPGNTETGLHPVMTGMRDMYADGKLAIVHSVSYPNPDLSHIRSTDIWMTGVDANQFSSSGWAGRYLNDRFAGYPNNYPNTEMEDPLAIQIGQMGNSAFLGNSQSMSITLENPTRFYQLIGTQNGFAEDYVPCCDAGQMITYVRQQQVLAVGYASEIQAAASAGQNLATYPTGNELADQLKIVARLIHGGLKAKVYYVEMGGFDTHAGQVGTSNTIGTHANLLKKLSDGISTFQNDLKLQGTEDKVIGMTFSDFGRRANSNASKGTDHGIAAPMFVFGTGIKRQLIGNNPDLVNGLLPPTGNGTKDIKMQIDFRRIYADILNDWFGTATTKTDQLLFHNFNTTSIFSTTVQSIGSGLWPNPEIWSNGRVPATNEFIVIKSGHVIEVGQNITARDIKVEGGGELKFLGDFNVNITG